MTDPVQHHCMRPWWKRPPVWVIGIAAVLLLGFFLMGATGRPPAISYGALLDQLESANVTSVVFHGTEIEGRLKQPKTIAGSSGPAQVEVFRSRIPDFGDPVLLSDLRRQHVAIDVTWSSPWGSWMGGGALAVIVGAVIFAKPGLLIFGGLLIAGLWRAIRGKKAAQPSVMPSGAMAMLPMHGMMKFTSNMFANAPPADSPVERKGCCAEVGDNPASAGSQSNLSRGPA